MNNKTTTNNLYWVYLVGFFLILFLPLVSLGPLFHPPAWVKSLLFRSIFSVLIFVFFYQILFKKQVFDFQGFKKDILDKKTPLFLPFWLLAAFFILYLLATIFSLEPYFSLWGSQYRGGGAVTLFFLVLFAPFVFLILKPRDWQKIWDYSLIIGFLVALIGFIQRFALLPKYIIPYTWQPVSTMGGAINFALYLILLVFMALGFGIACKTKKRFLYFGISAFLAFVIIITAVRAAFLGMFVGALFFIFFFPGKKTVYAKKIFWVKIIAGIILLLAIFGVFWLRAQPQIITTLEGNKLIGVFFQRLRPNIQNLSIDNIISSRGAGWKVAFQALKVRPIFGYGPENFSIGFDRYYDPALPGLLKQFQDTGTGWWDRAHNFLLDLGVTAGVPALLIFISLFVALFWQLQKIKNNSVRFLSAGIISHSIQTTIIAYFITNFFSFDVFSTYLVLFLIIGYCFHLLYEPNKEQNTQNFDGNKSKFYHQNKYSDYIVLAVLFFVVVWFIWVYNINPMLINKDINMAEYYRNNIGKKEGCIAALNLIGQASLRRSIADYHLELEYVDIINSCFNLIPEAKKDLLEKEIEILKESLKIRPYYTRAYILLATTSEILAGEDVSDEERNKLIEDSFYYTNIALQLAPKHQEVYVVWSKAFLLKGQNEEANEKADYCLKLNPDSADCWWAKTVVLANLGDIEGTIKSMKIAKEKGIDVDLKSKLSQLVKVFGAKAKNTGDFKYYKGLIVAYQELINFEPENFQHHASLAYVYKALGEYKNARNEAMIVLEMSPESKASVEKFLKSLPY